MGERKLSQTGKRTARKMPAGRRGNDLDELRERWTELTPLERGERLRTLIQQGISGRRVARLFGCSEATVRKYLLLTELPRAEKRAMAAGRLGAKRALRGVRERRKAKAPTEEEREAFIGKCGGLLAALIRRVVPSPYWGQLFVDLKGKSHWMRLQEGTGRESRESALRLAKNPRKTLGKCRPRQPKPSYVPELVSYCVDWIVAWFERVLPNASLRDAVLGKAVQLLRKEVGRQQESDSFPFPWWAEGLLVL